MANKDVQTNKQHIKKTCMFWRSNTGDPTLEIQHCEA